MLQISLRDRGSVPLLFASCVLLLGCGSAHDLDALGIPLPDGGLPGHAAGSGSVGVGGDGDVSAVGSGNPGGAAGDSANGSSNNSNGGGGNGGLPGAGGSNGGGFPLPGTGGSSGGGFPFPGAGGSSGGGFPGGGGNQTPPAQNVAACSPCQSATGTFGTVPACCTNTNACGVDLGALTGSGTDCVAQNQPGVDDGQCAPFDFMGTSVPGCCMPSGQCGVLIMRLAPLGCVQPDVVAGVLPGLTGGSNRGCRP